MSTPLHPVVHELNASFPFDVRLYAEDIDGSAAWAGALVEAGILTKEEREAIVKGLETIRAEFESDSFQPGPEDEDIHTAVERRLGELIGPVAGKLHTGRSRNDQVATDFRLWVMRACDRIAASIRELAQALAESARSNLETPMPGYTHLQPAQPITWGHWALAHVWPLLRDAERFSQTRRRAAVLPLGSGALAGTPLQFDRQALAQSLGFDDISQNSIDGVSDRDFALGFAYACAVLGVHLSRLAEQLILFNSVEFGFIEIDDAYATGSSLMPQKKNPDVLELTRGKAGRWIGNLTGLLATLKGLPSAYDKDLQEDKEPVFDGHDGLSLVLPALTGLVQTLRLRPEQMAARLTPDLLATDLADYLVSRGVPFREAHGRIGRVVKKAAELGVALNEVPLEDLKRIDESFEGDFLEIFNVRAALARRSSQGGTSPQALEQQLEQALAALA